MIKNFKARELSTVRERMPLSNLLFSESVSLLQRLIKTPSFSGQETEAADHGERRRRRRDSCHSAEARRTDPGRQCPRSGSGQRDLRVDPSRRLGP